MTSDQRAFVGHRFDPPLVGGELLRRYKRFLADVRLDGGAEVTVHTANPGRMTGLATPGARVWLSHHDNPKRKLPWTWEVTTTDEGALAGVNPILSNRLVAEALTHDLIAELRGYDTARREVSCDGGRIDFLLSDHSDDPRPCWLEVKTVTLAGQDGEMRFPDAPTARGQRHLRSLTDRVAAGDRAVLCFVVQRGDARRVAPADDIDPAYAEAFYQALLDGVEVVAWRCLASPEGIRFDAPLPVRRRA